jgi:hypothetical protein
MNPTVTLKVTDSTGKSSETSTKAYTSAEAALEAFTSIHKDSIQRLGLKVEAKK